jgi:hypothetical protein
MLFIFNNRHASLFRHNLNRGNPLTVRNVIDDQCRSFKTSFLTTSLIALLSLRYGSLEGIELVSTKYGQQFTE